MADSRFKKIRGWRHWSFVGDRWNRIKKKERQSYLKNAYRVLLTRARQGMVIVVPLGDLEDATRNPAYYDSTYDYLKDIGFATL
jgi:Schlafen group 3, DNA/RNA helicase domain